MRKTFFEPFFSSIIAMKKIIPALILIVISLQTALAQIPVTYKGKPFKDRYYKKDAQVIPGRIELAYYDMGGEGIAYHDTEPINKGSGLLNRKPEHQRPGVSDYICHFRENEGVDISYTKDFIDFNHPNKVDPGVNQFFLAYEADSEWVNYTIDVKVPGKYKIISIYSNQDNKCSLWLNNEKAVDLVLTENTGNYHVWTQGTIGEITFPKAGINLLTLKYNNGANITYFDFSLVEELK
jgi:hypothetical protein